jgi:hypothetical protein
MLVFVIMTVEWHHKVIVFSYVLFDEYVESTRIKYCIDFFVRLSVFMVVRNLAK